MALDIVAFGEVMELLKPTQAGEVVETTEGFTNCQAENLRWIYNLCMVKTELWSSCLVCNLQHGDISSLARQISS